MVNAAPAEKPVRNTRWRSTHVVCSTWCSSAVTNAGSGAPQVCPVPSGATVTMPRAAARCGSWVRSLNFSALLAKPWNSSTSGAGAVAFGMVMR